MRREKIRFLAPLQSDMSNEPFRRFTIVLIELGTKENGDRWTELVIAQGYSAL